MKLKASFMNIPCYFDEDANEITARYGWWWNDILLSIVLLFWTEFGWIFNPDNEAGFPIIIYEDNKQKEHK